MRRQTSTHQQELHSSAPLCHSESRAWPPRVTPNQRAGCIALRNTVCRGSALTVYYSNTWPIDSVMLCSPHVDFCGYSMPHPAEAVVNIRVQTTGQPSTALHTCICAAKLRPSLDPRCCETIHHILHTESAHDHHNLRMRAQGLSTQRKEGGLRNLAIRNCLLCQSQRRDTKASHYWPVLLRWKKMQ